MQNSGYVQSYTKIHLSWATKGLLTIHIQQRCLQPMNQGVEKFEAPSVVNLLKYLVRLGQQQPQRRRRYAIPMMSAIPQKKSPTTKSSTESDIKKRRNTRPSNPCIATYTILNFIIYNISTTIVRLLLDRFSKHRWPLPIQTLLICYTTSPYSWLHFSVLMSLHFCQRRVLGFLGQSCSFLLNLCAPFFYLFFGLNGGGSLLFCAHVTSAPTFSVATTRLIYSLLDTGLQLVMPRWS